MPAPVPRDALPRRAPRQAPGQEHIYVGGEKEFEREKTVREAGIPVNQSLRRELQVMRDELQIAGYEAYF